MEKILVTSALPYANGPIHFGHIAGAYLPADIFVRFKRLTQADVVYVSGTDEHGFAITVSAEKEGNSPQAHVDKYHGVISGIFEQFNIKFDNFSQTTRPHHYKLAQEFFKEIYDNGYISKRTTDQLYDKAADKFLADRYVTGTCPECQWEEARGDECPKCGQWLDPLNLIDPKSAITGNTPIIKQTTHWFIELGKFSERLEKWLATKTDWKPNVKNFISKMIESGLEGRPITRDMNWGVPVPLEEAKDKVMYVWFDAPIGYVSSTMEWAEAQGKPDAWKDYWQDEKTRLVHFIGKDNLPFHCVVWPSMIMGQDQPYILPTDVPANEFYNLEGKPFSKSEGWYVDLDEFFSSYTTDSIRYTIAANAPETKDSDFSWKDFQGRNNSELADIFGNFINRTLKFTAGYFDNKVPEDTGDTPELLIQAQALLKELTEHFDNYRLRKATYTLMELARIGNRYFDEQAPWKSRKTDMVACGRTLNHCLQLTRLLALAAAPIIPESAQKIWKMLGHTDQLNSHSWDDIASTNLTSGHALGEAEVLFTKIENDAIENEQAKLNKLVKDDKAAKKAKKEAAKKANAKKNKSNDNDDSSDNLVDFSQVMDVKLKVAQVLEAEEIPKSKKLLKLQVDLGNEKRQIVAGVKEHYSAEQMLGKKIIVVANLKPAKLMGIESQGMLLAAKDENGLHLITPDAETITGSSVS